MVKQVKQALVIESLPVMPRVSRHYGKRWFQIHASQLYCKSDRNAPVGGIPGGKAILCNPSFQGKELLQSMWQKVGYLSGTLELLDNWTAGRENILLQTYSWQIASEAEAASGLEAVS